MIGLCTGAIKIARGAEEPNSIREAHYLWSETATMIAVEMRLKRKIWKMGGMNENRIAYSIS